MEGLRTDSLYWGSVRVSQAASLIAMAVVLVWFFLRVKENRKKAALPFGAAAVFLCISLAESFGILGPNAIRMLVSNVCAAQMTYMLYKLVPNFSKEAGVGR